MSELPGEPPADVGAQLIDEPPVEPPVEPVEAVTEQMVVELIRSIFIDVNSRSIADGLAGIQELGNNSFHIWFAYLNHWINDSNTAASWKTSFSAVITEYAQILKTRIQKKSPDYAPLYKKLQELQAVINGQTEAPSSAEI